jgi:hypothetical protein
MKEDSVLVDDGGDSKRPRGQVDWGGQKKQWMKWMNGGWIGNGSDCPEAKERIKKKREEDS